MHNASFIARPLTSRTLHTYFRFLFDPYTSLTVTYRAIYNLICVVEACYYYSAFLQVY